MLANLGILYENKGDLPDAYTYLQQAVNLDPTDTDYQQALQVLEMKGSK